jgi:hypothetical protein
MYSSPEFNNNLTSTYTEYNNLNKYNTIFAQKVPSSVPSMNFPVLLEQSNIYGYNALTHDGDGSNYYTVKTGYSSSCNPNYYVAKCPNNKFIRSFLPDSNEIVSPSACPVENSLVSEGYSPPDLLSKIKSLNLIIFYDKNCMYSKNLLQELNNTLGATLLNQYVQLKDIAVGSNEQELTNLGGYAVPFIYSKTTNNSITGYSSLSNIIMTLSQIKTPDNSPELIKTIKNLKLSVYVMENCIYCSKLKDLLKNHLPSIKIKNGLAPENASVVQNAKGFPYIVSEKTKKTLTGLPPSVSSLVKSLS